CRSAADREEVHKLSILEELLFPKKPGFSVLLARVISVKRQPEELYRRFRQAWPLGDPEKQIGVVGARFSVIETLWGPPIDGAVDVVSSSHDAPPQVFGHLSRLPALFGRARPD